LNAHTSTDDASKFLGASDYHRIVEIRKHADYPHLLIPH